MSGPHEVVRLAPLGSRVNAALIDTLVLMVTHVALVWGLQGSEALQSGGEIEPRVVFIGIIVQLSYFVVLEGTWNATLGKRIMGLKVVRSDGATPGPWGVIVRNLLRYVDMLPAFYIVGLITVMITPGRQRVGDLAGGTLVVMR